MAEYSISFPEQALATRDQYAGSLVSLLRETHPDISVERRKGRAETQNAGEIIQLVMASTAIASVAKGISSWIARNSGATVRIDLPDGTHVEIKHAGENVAETVKAVFLRSGGHNSET